MKIDSTVWKETKYIAAAVLLMSILMQAVFLIIGQWNYTVLLGNILCGAAGVFNFFMMGITVQKALAKDEETAKTTMKLSQTYRTLFLAVVLIVAFTVPCFHRWASLIALFFPRIAVMLRPALDKRK